MTKLAASLLALALAAGCSPTGYYVANVYQSGNILLVQRCAIDAGNSRDKPDPSNCRYEQVGPPPADAKMNPFPPPAPPQPSTPPENEPATKPAF